MKTLKIEFLKILTDKDYTKISNFSKIMSETYHIKM